MDGEHRTEFKDFLFSFGMTVAGLILLFLGSVTIVPRASERLALPKSSPRQFNFEKTLNAAALPASHSMVPVAVSSTTAIPKLTAAAAVIVDDKTGTVLWSKNPDEVRSLASITKLISALVILDCVPNWATTTIILDNDDVESSHFLYAGEKITAEDLWHAALIGSSNGAINALARIACPKEFTEFVLQMNVKAQALGLNTLRLVEPTGLDSGNRGTAMDIIKLLAVALEKEKIADTLATGEYYIRPVGEKTPRRVWSTNWLLTNWIPNRFGPAKIAGKTGFINDSGYNFVVRIKNRDNQAVRVVVLGTASNEARFTEARDLAEWAFANYRWPTN